MAAVTERQGKILALIVEKYIATGEPVGSKVLCAELENAVSSATIRNDMALLAAQGLIIQPHTSAGRIPSQSGYRYYVDNLMKRFEMSAEEQSRIRMWLEAFAGEPDLLLEKAGGVLAELTKCAVISSSPSDGDAVIKRIELVPIGTRTAMVVLLTSSGILKNHVCRTDTEITLQLAEVFYNIVKSQLIGRRAADLTTAYIQTLAASLGDRALVMSPLLITVSELAASAVNTEVHLKGQSNILGYSELAQNAYELMNFLHMGVPVSQLISSSQKRDLSVNIGSENSFRELHNSTTIFSKYTAGERDSGVVGIVGPTRLDYQRLIPGIQYLTNLVGSLLSEAADE